MKRIDISKALERVESSGDYIDEAFGYSGPFAKKFSGYEHRDGQIEFAHAVDDSIAEKRTLLCEAGTGVGKSAGYLTPIILNLQHGKKTIVVTAGITLQEQLVKKDLPMLQEVLGKPFTFAIAKGFGNFICQYEMFEAEKELKSGKIRLPIAGHRELFNRVINEVPINGDTSEYEFEIPGPVKQLVTTSTEDCYGRKCEYFKDCFPIKAKKAYGTADIIVTNYHMYALDLEMRRTSNGEISFLPEHEILVMDEFHESSEIFRSFMGEKVSRGMIRSAIEYLEGKDRRSYKLGIPRDIDLGLKAAIEEETDIFFKELITLRKDENKYYARLNRPGMIDGTKLESLLKKAAEVYINAGSDMEMPGEAKNWLHSRSYLLKKQASVIEGARNIDNDFLVFYIDLISPRDDGQGNLFGEERAVLIREPITPSKTLKEELFENEREPNTIIGCSATLCTGKDTPFGYVARQNGIENYDECVAESPFDYSKMCFIIPRDLPEPESYGPKELIYRNAVSKYLCDTVEMAQGRTLGLFTSYKSLDSAHKALIESGCPYKVYKQGEAPRMTLIKLFKENEESVLLGTESFWTGIDVPGNSLLAVFMDKLPFPNQKEPVLDALKEKEGEKFFNKVVIPRTVQMFKQGVGRLIRSVNDHGVVVCCDRRIATKGYGRSFTRALPYDCKVSDDINDVAKYCWPKG